MLLSLLSWLSSLLLWMGIMPLAAAAAAAAGLENVLSLVGKGEVGEEGSSEAEFVIEAHGWRGTRRRREFGDGWSRAVSWEGVDLFFLGGGGRGAHFSDFEPAIGFVEGVARGSYL